MCVVGSSQMGPPTLTLNPLWYTQVKCSKETKKKMLKLV